MLDRQYDRTRLRRRVRAPEVPQGARGAEGSGVPTPLRKTKDPDMSYIVSACEEIARYFEPGKLVILESTTYPGSTNSSVVPG